MPYHAVEKRHKRHRDPDEERELTAAGASGLETRPPVLRSSLQRSVSCPEPAVNHCLDSLSSCVESEAYLCVCP